MKSILFFLLLLIPYSFFSQDGSDIQYIEAAKINSENVGKFVHLDFYNNSFGRKRILDSIDLSINNKVFKFIEIRKDTGHNNWFDEQSLISVSKVKGQKIQIEKFKLTGIDSKNLYVTAFINYLKHDKILSKSKEDMIIEKSKVVEILVEKD